MPKSPGRRQSKDEALIRKFVHHLYQQARDSAAKKADIPVAALKSMDTLEHAYTSLCVFFRALPTPAKERHREEMREVLGRVEESQ